MQVLRDKNDRILTLLCGPKYRSATRDDGEEFLSTLQFVDSTLGKIDRAMGNCTLRSVLIGQINDDLSTYEQKLQGLVKQGKFVRFLTNNRLRKGLDRLNSTLCLRVKQLQEEIEAELGSSLDTVGASNLNVGSTPHSTVATNDALHYANVTPSTASYLDSSNFASPVPSGFASPVHSRLVPPLRSGFASPLHMAQSAVNFSSVNAHFDSMDATKVPQSAVNFASINAQFDHSETPASSTVIGASSHAPKAQLSQTAEVAHSTPNADALQQWIDMFGRQTAIVSWEEFVGRFRDLAPLEVVEEFVLKDVLDHSNTGSVNQFKFCEFLKGFGPTIYECITNLMYIYHQDWFHGFVTQIEARKFLEVEPLGTFLVRFSSSKPGSFVIEYVTIGEQAHDSCEYGVIEDAVHPSLGTNDLIVNSVYLDTSPMGFAVRTASSTYNFATIEECLLSFTHIFHIPFATMLPKEPWFHGDLNSSEVEELLRGHPVGTFLIRFSSQKGCYAASFVTERGTIGKSLISPANGGYQIEMATNSKTYPTLKDMVKEYVRAGFFRMPFNEADHTSVSAKMMVPGARNTPGWVTEATMQRIRAQQQVPRTYPTPVPVRIPVASATDISPGAVYKNVNFRGPASHPRPGKPAARRIAAEVSGRPVEVAFRRQPSFTISEGEVSRHARPVLMARGSPVSRQSPLLSRPKTQPKLLTVPMLPPKAVPKAVPKGISEYGGFGALSASGPEQVHAVVSSSTARQGHGVPKFNPPIRARRAPPPSLSTPRLPPKVPLRPGRASGQSNLNGLPTRNTSPYGPASFVADRGPPIQQVQAETPPPIRRPLSAPPTANSIVGVHKQQPGLVPKSGRQGPYSGIPVRAHGASLRDDNSFAYDPTTVSASRGGVGTAVQYARMPERGQ